MTGSKEMGDFGERVAAHRLESIGCKILARNVRTASGEIDIIVRDGEDVAFVEVRTRRADPGTAAESLDEKKLQRMWRCAMEYCDTTDTSPELVRIDLISIDLARGGKKAHIEHFRALEIPDWD